MHQYTMETDVDEDGLAKIQLLLPDLTERTVVQLGGGCRQLTAIMAQKANKVIIYAFGEEITEETKNLGKDYVNTQFIVVKDFKDINCPDSSVDLLFSNWSYKDRGDLLEKQLSWLKPNGHLLLQDCFSGSSDEKVKGATTSAERSFQTCETRLSSLLELFDDHDVYWLDVIFQVKSGKNCIFTLLQKCERDGSSNDAVKNFDKRDEYTISRILLYEKAFGYNFLSLGGEDVIEEIVSFLDLKPGQKILDIGGGIGGSAFYLVKNFGVSVISVDISPNVAVIGRKRAREAGIGPDQVVFETADATQLDYPMESFDVVYSVATFLYIEDKVSVLKRLHNLLKPGGRLMITDYCHGNGELSKSFQSFIKDHKYKVISSEKYQKILSEDAGFVNTKVVDKSHKFLHDFQEMTTELGEKKECIQELGATNWTWLLNKWKVVIGHFDRGDLKYGYFYAEKSK